PHRPGDLSGWDLQDLDVVRGVEVTGSSDLDFRITTARDDRGQPTDFQLPADNDQQVRLVGEQDEAGLRLDEMRILIALGEGVDLDLVASDLLCHRSKV